MNTYKILAIIGFILFLVPFIGLPFNIKLIIMSALGGVIMIISLVIYKRLSKRKNAQADPADNDMGGESEFNNILDEKKTEEQ